jgi:hypothetical protein
MTAAGFDLPAVLLAASLVPLLGLGITERLLVGVTIGEPGVTAIGQTMSRWAILARFDTNLTRRRGATWAPGE